MKGIVVLFLVSATALAQQQPAPGSAGGSWHQQPFRVKAGERLLDTFDSDPGGHAAPFLADADNDGRRDLTVGSIGGQFHFYRNIGTDAAPRFADKAVKLMAGLSADEPAEVPNFCCVAAGAQLFDVDGDGVLDLSSGSYLPGFVYWFKGKRDGTFHARHTLTDVSARPVLPCPEENSYLFEQDNLGNYMTNIAWTDWDANGHPDLILGNFKGQLFFRLNARGVLDDAGLESMPARSQPQFMHKQPGKADEILIDGKTAIPEHHAAPAVADWDGDGLWDILVGAESGRVYWLRNTGKVGAPVFKDRQEILGPGAAAFWVEPGKEPGRGTRAQIQVVDYNRDGKLDLLVGEWCVVETPRPDLTARERREMESIRKELRALDEKMGFKTEYTVRYKLQTYSDDKEALQRAQALETALTRFLVQHSHRESPDYLRFTLFQRNSGLVSVFLKK